MAPMIKIGEPAPLFQLTDLQGIGHSLGKRNESIFVLNFWSAECDWCERVDQEIKPYLETWQDVAKVMWIASNSGEPIELIQKVAMSRKLPIVVLDEHHKVADLYGAITTPHFFVVDKAGILRYQGAWDDITFRHRTASQVYVPKVIEALRQNTAPAVTQSPPYGCALVRF